MLRHNKLLCSTSTDAHHQIRTGKEHIKPVQIFHYSSIYCFGVSKLLLHNKEWMLDFAANGGLSCFYIFIPVEPGIIILVDLYTGWTTVYSEDHILQMLIIFEFGPFLHPQVS